MLRQALIFIRKNYNTNFKNFIVLLSATLGVSAIVSLLVDVLLPFNSWGNIVRTLILIPLSASIFTAGYCVGMVLHRRQMSENPEWVPFRLRFSPMVRRRISAIIGAVLFVFIYATGQKVGYTLMSSIFVAIIIALFAFMRNTRDERVRSELNIPDKRDIKYDYRKRQLEEARKDAEREKRKKRTKLMNVVKGTKDADGE